MKKNVITLALALCSLATFAQETASTTAPKAPAEKESKFTAAIDVVAPYLWRGIALTSTSKVAFQPYASYAFTDKFTIGVWATSNLKKDETVGNSSYNEFDWYASYQISPVVKAMLSDYYYDTPSFKNSYFDYGKNAGHAFDLSLLMDFSDKGAPIDFQINTLIGGNDLNNDGKRNYSTYSEIGYSHTIESAGIDLRAFVGAVLGKSNYYVTDKTKFTNVGLNLAKEIKISEDYSLPVFLRYTYNQNGNYNKDGELKNNFISGGITFTIK